MVSKNKFYGYNFLRLFQQYQLNYYKIHSILAFLFIILIHLVTFN